MSWRDMPRLSILRYTDVRIIKEGKVPNPCPPVLFTCDKCGCHFEALGNLEAAMIPTQDPDEQYVWEVECPTCFQKCYGPVGPRSQTWST